MILDLNKLHVMTPGGKIVQVLTAEGEYDQAATEAEAAQAIEAEAQEAEVAKEAARIQAHEEEGLMDPTRGSELG